MRSDRCHAERYLELLGLGHDPGEDDVAEARRRLVPGLERGRDGLAVLRIALRDDAQPVPDLLARVLDFPI
jgi:hypothetical protein